nr:unnamed protein product [Digitaria exilis]
MWVFYLISLPLTLGMVVVTLRYFAGPAVPRYVVATVGYAWFCSLSIIILVPADIWTLREDPSFKPSGGRLGENDMDYDTDDKSMATLRRQLRRAHEEYYRCKREFL